MPSSSQNLPRYVNPFDSPIIDDLFPQPETYRTPAGSVVDELPGASQPVIPHDPEHVDQSEWVYSDEETDPPTESEIQDDLSEQRRKHAHDSYDGF